MGKQLKNFSVRVFISSLALIGICLNAAIAENILSAIQINPDNASYQIILKSDNPAPIKKVIEAPDKMYLELQNIQALSSISTIYNNVPNVDNVIVQPVSKNSVKIFLQGKNIAKSKISFETLKTTPMAIPSSEKSDTIKLNRPLETYAPVVTEEITEDESTGIQNNPMLMSLLSLIKNNMNAKSMMYFIGFMLILVFGLRAFKKNAQYTNNQLQIGLSHRLREDSLRDELNAEESVRPETSRLSLHKNNTYSTPTANYGLKSYQNSQKSPYTSPIPPKQFTKPSSGYNTTPLPKATIPQSRTEIQSTVAPAQNLLRPTSTQSATRTQQSIANSIASAEKKQAAGGVDSMKFIESMSKIYEKNGRSDLASGLRNNMRKAQNLQNQI